MDFNKIRRAERMNKKMIPEENQKGFKEKTE